MSKIQIVIPGVPADLLKDIDALAKRDSRKRADTVRLLLKEIVAAKRAAGQLKAA
jgi:metal-responsive CopG/Arc/MetJ family transcriptional regulator